MEQLLVLAAVMVIAFISFIIKQVNKAQQERQVQLARNRPRQRPRPRDDRLQNEIDVFLQEVTGRGQGARAEPMEIVEIESSPQSAQRREKPPKPQSRRRKPGSSIEQREGPGSKDLGGDVRAHLSEHMQEGRVTGHVETYLNHDVDDSVAAHLGAFTAEKKRGATGPAATATRQRVGASTIVNLLRNPAGVRQAILVSEILSPPKGRRGRS